MMNNNITLRTSNTAANTENTFESFQFENFDPVQIIANTKPIRTLSEMYSGLMEEYVSPRFTLHLVNVQMAAFFTIMPAEVNLFIRILCLLWFATSLCLAKRAYQKQA